MSQAEMLPAPGGDGWRFSVWHPPAQVPGSDAKGLVLHVHAFAEEMNKSRRQCGRQARQLAAEGFGVLQFDLLGCGDSSGDFKQASWELWIEDVVWAAESLRLRFGKSGPELPLWIWGHRVGSLLAGSAAARLQAKGIASNLLLWQPVVKGAVALKQFLRIRAAAGLMGSSESRESTDGMLKRLQAGETLDVGGYALSPALALGLAGSNLEPGSTKTHVVWLDVGSGNPPTTSPAAAQTAARWQAAGWEVDQSTVGGPAFWQTSEIEDAPELLLATSARLEAARSAWPAGNGT